MANTIFKKTAMKSPRRNTFNLSHDRKMSFDFGELVPIMVMDVVPGDKVTLSSAQMLRMSPLVAPPMHNANVYVHHYFVPNRLVWPNWQKFITGGEDGEDVTVPPYIQPDAAESSEGTLCDYLGLPSVGVPYSTARINPMVFSAYQLIYNEYYRDQNLVDEVPYELQDGSNTNTVQSSIVTLRNRAWAHDYFTSALPWTQKGAEALIPLGTTADLDFVPDGAPSVVTDLAGSPYPPTVDLSTTGGLLSDLVTGGQTTPLNMNVAQQHKVNLSTAQAASINDLRRAFRLQEWLEKNARGGSRYIESIYSHFGVKSSDARLQRPEYLGGGYSPIKFSEVLQTSGSPSPTDGYTPTPQGNMAGHGINVGASGKCAKFIEEHGYIISIMSVMPQPAYQQGIPKHFLRNDKFDYYWPSFANLGEQPILNAELYFENSNVGGETFGYTPRYAEYKFIPNTVHGQFRSTFDYWHMGRIFDSLPALNEEFITMKAQEVSRIFAVTDDAENKIYGHIFNNIKASRLMPVFGTPTI